MKRLIAGITCELCSKGPFSSQEQKAAHKCSKSHRKKMPLKPNQKPDQKSVSIQKVDLIQKSIQKVDGIKLVSGRVLTVTHRHAFVAPDIYVPAKFTKDCAMKVGDVLKVQVRAHVHKNHSNNWIAVGPAELLAPAPVAPDHDILHKNENHASADRNKGTDKCEKKSSKLCKDSASGFRLFSAKSLQAFQSKQCELTKQMPTVAGVVASARVSASFRAGLNHAQAEDGKDSTLPVQILKQMDPNSASYRNDSTNIGAPEDENTISTTCLKEESDQVQQAVPSAQDVEWACGTCTFLHSGATASFLVCKICSLKRGEISQAMSLSSSDMQQQRPLSRLPEWKTRSSSQEKSQQLAAAEAARNTAVGDIPAELQKEVVEINHYQQHLDCQIPLHLHALEQILNAPPLPLCRPHANASSDGETPEQKKDRYGSMLISQIQHHSITKQALQKVTGMLLVALSHPEHFLGLTYRELDYFLMQDKRGHHDAGHNSLLWAKVACCAC